jgi:hypothetical protein
MGSFQGLFQTIKDLEGRFCTLFRHLRLQKKSFLGKSTDSDINLPVLAESALKSS